MKAKNRQEELHWNHKIDFEKHLTKPRYWKSKSPELKTRIQCRICNVYIKWPSIDEVKHWQKVKTKNFTFSEFIKDFNKNGHISTYGEPVSLPGEIVSWLNTPYQDKDQVKLLGAYWNYTNKQWYCFTSNKNLDKLIPWMDNIQLDRLHEHLSLQGNYKPSLPETENYTNGMYRLIEAWKPE